MDRHHNQTGIASRKSRHSIGRVFAIWCIGVLLILRSEAGCDAAELELVRPSDDGKTFVGVDSGRTVQLWGVNYDRDAAGQLIEDYWHDEWPRIVEDFQEMKALGANAVRVHLQLGRFMKAADEPNDENLARLAKLLGVAEENRLYLIITGLGCYHKADVPAWYDRLPEPERWQVQAEFWKAVAGVCKDSRAVFSYNLMNEPVLPGEMPATDWLGPPLGDKHYVQRIALDLAGRSREHVAKSWVTTLTGAIREVDPQHMITVGVIPWALVFPKAKPLFYSPAAGAPLDYVSVHFYPERGQVDKAIEALRVYEVGKPLVVEEMFPLKCSADELLEFVDRSRPYADGWVSFYWGQSIEECRQRGDMGGAITAAWLEKFQKNAPDGPSNEPRR